MADLARARVLLVEDSATMRGFVAAVLEAGGAFEVTQAASGFEALKLLPRLKYDLIITDINMPDINGLELVRYIRDSERHATTALIVISTDSRPADRERGLKLGADAYLNKPFAPEALLEVIRQVRAGRAQSSSSSSDPPADGPADGSDG